MHECRQVIPEELMVARLAQAEQMREFFIQMWLENPQLIAKAGSKIQKIMAPLAVPPGPTFPWRQAKGAR